MFIAFGFVVCNCLTQSLAQVPATLQTIQPKVDSLTSLLKHVQGKERYVVLRDIAYEYYDIDNERGLEFIKQANALAIQLGDSMDIVHSTRMLGQLLRRTGRTREGVKALLVAFEIAKKIRFEKEELRIAGSLGLAYLRSARFDSSLRFTYYALRMRMKRGEHEEVGHLWGNIGLLYYKLGHFEEALRYYRKATAAYQLVGIVGPTHLITNIAFCEMRMGKPAEARVTLDLWQASCLTGACGAADSLQWILAEGVLLFLDGQMEQSKPWFHKGLRKADEIGDGTAKLGAMEYVGRCLLAENNARAAKLYLEEARDLAVKGGDDFFLADIYDLLIAVTKQEGDQSSVRILQSKLIETTRRVFNEKVLHTVAVARVEFEEYENQLLIAKQAEVLRLNGEAIQRHRWLILLSAGLSIVLSMLVIVLFRFNRFQKRISHDLDRRVFDRTRELEASEKALVNTISEQKALMEVISGKILSSIATLRGLWLLRGYGSIEPCITDFDRAAKDLLQVPRIIKHSIGGRTDNIEAQISH